MLLLESGPDDKSPLIRMPREIDGIAETWADSTEAQARMASEWLLAKSAVEVASEETKSFLALDDLGRQFARDQLQVPMMATGLAICGLVFAAVAAAAWNAVSDADGVRPDAFPARATRAAAALRR